MGRYLIALSGLLGAFAVMSLGCTNYVGKYYDPLADPNAGTGGGNNVPAGCVPSENPMQPVHSYCGIFVSATGDDANQGSPDKPVKTLARAFTVAGAKKPVYACAGVTPFSEMVTIPAGGVLFGGLDCGSWRYIGDVAKTTITADLGKVPVTLAMGSGTKLFDLHIKAAPAMDQGGSSVATIADHVTASLDGCVLEAGDGKEGGAGLPYPTAAQAGVNGNAGGNACTSTTVVGGAAVSSMCGSSDSISGQGGNGGPLSGGNGSDGQPGLTVNSGKGQGASPCTPGTKGSDGVHGMDGSGAAGLGAISASGYMGVAGGQGAPGEPAQGGGGGGGSKGGVGPMQCLAGMPGGAAGGSGGSGGCGGAAGNGGQAGGASIALISVESTLRLTNVSMKTGNGGKGGNGAMGQSGGPPGLPGAGGKAPAGLTPGCDGGLGGLGGNGGNGGGGLGGHSVGVAFTGTMPVLTMATFDVKGTPGVGGAGVDPLHDGTAGVQADVQEFK